MGTTTVMVQRNDPAMHTATLKDDPTLSGTQGFHFGRGDTLVIAIDTTSLPLGTVFKSISFYPTADESVPMGTETWVRIDLPNLPSGEVVISGRRSYGGPNINMFILNWTATDLNDPIRITDMEHTNGSDCSGVRIVVTDPTVLDWTLDPELVNTSGGGSSSGWGPVRPATMVQMVAL